MTQPVATPSSGHDLERSADALLQQVENIIDAHSKNVEEAVAPSSGAQQQNAKEDGAEEEKEQPQGVAKRPAAKTGAKKITMADVQDNMTSKSSKLRDHIAELKMAKEVLRKKRQVESKKLVQAERKVKRIKAKAALLSNNDLMEVFLFRKEQEEKASASASSQPAAIEDDKATTATRMALVKGNIQPA